MKPSKFQSGQSLVEILVAVAIGAIIIGGASYAISFILLSGTANEQRQTATILANDVISKVQAVADANWLDIYNLSGKGPASQFKIAASGIQLAVATGTATSSINSTVYTFYFSVENVNRDASDNIVTSGGTNDPSTQKVTAKVEWVNRGLSQNFQLTEYLTRWRNNVFNQTDWSGGASADAVLSQPDNKFSTSANIDVTSTPGSIKLILP